MTGRLGELAQRHAIAPEYHDLWGRAHQTAPEVERALLAAMHVDAGTDEAAAAALASHERRTWERALPAAWAAGADGGDGPTLRLSPALDAATLAWQIQAEDDGTVREGTLHGAELPEIARAEVEGTMRIARRWAAPADLPQGYHRLTLRHDGAVLGTCLLIVAPPTIYTPPALADDGRTWGGAVQLYAVRSARNWGMGDFSDLGAIAHTWGSQGAALVGVNPLHAMFPHNPAHASPYSPSSRLFLNTLYLDVEAIPDFEESPEAAELVRSAAFQARLEALRATERVDYVGVATAKREVLGLLHESFLRRHARVGTAPAATTRAEAFTAFCAARGESLRRHALFEALQERFHAADASVWGWPVWPAEYRDPDSPAVHRFEAEQRDRVDYFRYLQWQADLQLAEAARRGSEAGLHIGLYQDLAVSIDRAGAEAWSEQALYATGASVGAPPDDFNLLGQNWGLPPLIPDRLAESAYAPFIETLRACMRHAGALRIDHVMALMRLYWIPEGRDASQGAYVQYPFADLLAIVRLESRRHRCVVIGEDLGTVPQEVRERLSASGVLSYRLLLTERDPEGDFPPPSGYAGQALLAAGTHDLPTLAGWWEGLDLELRTRLDLFPDAAVREQQSMQRAGDRARLLLALDREGLLPPAATLSPASLPEMTPALSEAVHQHLARSPAKILLVQLEDVLGVREQVNQPGTTDAHPNWQQKSPVPVERWAEDARFLALSQRIEKERPPRVQAAGAAGVPQQAVIPRATYRVQLHQEFRFADATALVPYLAQLGISHLYCSPFLRARAGSLHGYDIVDHNAFNPEIGDRADFDALVKMLREHGMGMLIDVVPNHMGVLGGDNAWWLDVLENGRASAHAEFFDIDWAPADPVLAGKVLLPILGEQYGIVLERGELKLDFDAAFGRFTLTYYEHRLPIDPAGYGGLLRQALRRWPVGQASPEHARQALEELATRFAELPPHDSTDPALRARRHRDATVLKAQLAQQATRYEALATALTQAAQALNGNPRSRTSFDKLDTLIAAQAYRLANWRVAGDEINYRRFFDINELAALRMEEPHVFEATHRLVLDLAQRGDVDGLRIDHPDGLADPAAYFRRLQDRYAQLTGGAAPLAGDDGQPGTPLSLYVAVEKIVAPHEALPRDWAVHGTTGYRFANIAINLMIDGSAKARLDRVWRAFVEDEAEDFEELATRCRHLVMEGSLAAELTVLASRLLRLAREDRRTRDFTLDLLRRTLAAVVACFPVYRTYVVDKPSAQDRRFIEWAIGRSRRRSRAEEASAFDFLRRVLLGRPLPGAAPGLGERYRDFARRLQQYTAPVAAKGIEDTALYRHHRLISVNDVGGDPDAFGLSVAAFHAATRDRRQHWPHTMLATSTHDAKRSEDVRLRIDVISEVPAAWRLTVRRWRRFNRRHKRIVGGVQAPSRNDEYLLYQTLIGSLPAGPLEAEALAGYAARVDAAMLKSARESKAVTSWINPNPAYEEALSGFVQAALSRPHGDLFFEDLQATAALFAWYGALNGLSATLLKVMSPGVPDIYQGNETIELALVDPDNRRPVDYALRRERLADAVALEAMPERSGALGEMLAHAVDGRAKFWVLRCALQVRRRQEPLLRDGDYLPLKVHGSRESQVIAFARRHGSDWLIVVATRLFVSLGLATGEPPVGAIWGDTALELPDAMTPGTPGQDGPRLREHLSGRDLTVVGGRLALATLLSDLPVALLGMAEAAAQ